MYNWDHENCPLYRVAGVCYSGVAIEVNGRTVGMFRIVRYIVGVRCCPVEGCPLSGVPLYT